MPSYNKTILMGNITRDPEIREAGQSQVCNFSLAVNRKWKNRDGDQQEEVTFVDVECWGRTAELVAKYLEKGSAVHVDGRLKQDTWEDKETGQKRSKIKVVAESIQFMNGNRSERSEPSEHERAKVDGYQPDQRGPSVPPPANDEDDLPF